MLNAEKTEIVTGALKAELKDVSVKGYLNHKDGINAHVKTINTDGISFIDGLCRAYSLKISLKRSGTGISIRFTNN